MWLALRLVVEQRATMTEITTTLSIDDVDMLARAMYAWDDAEREAQSE